LFELKGACELVLADNSKISELLPPTSGFFFGNTEIDDYYFRDLRNTINFIDKALALQDKGYNIYYQASW
jgi:hypothetical protein